MLSLRISSMTWPYHRETSRRLMLCHFSGSFLFSPGVASGCRIWRTDGVVADYPRHPTLPLPTWPGVSKLDWKVYVGVLRRRFNSFVDKNTVFGTCCNVRKVRYLNYLARSTIPRINCPLSFHELTPTSNTKSRIYEAKLKSGTSLLARG